MLATRVQRIERRWRARTALEDHPQKTESKLLADVKKAFGGLGGAIMKVYSTAYSWKGRAMETEKHEKKWVKHLRRMAWFAIGAILFFAVALWVAPKVEIHGARIPLGRLQLAYGLLSVVIAVALYAWGVGNWSRFEPPKPTPATGSNAATGNAPVTSPPGTPARKKGAN